MNSFTFFFFFSFFFLLSSENEIYLFTHSLIYFLFLIYLFIYEKMHITIFLKDINRILGTRFRFVLEQDQILQTVHLSLFFYCNYYFVKCFAHNGF